MLSGNPKILFISDCWPHGKAFGGQLRALHTARALNKIGNVSFVVVSADSGDEEALRKTAEEFNTRPPVRPFASPNRGLGQKLRWAFDPRYLNVHGCVATPPDRARIGDYFAEFELVWVLNSRTPNVLQIGDWPHSHLDLSDVPSTYLGTLARNGASAGERWKARLQQVLFKRRELLFKKRFTTLSVCSEEDRVYLGGGDQIHVIPNGFQRPATEPVPNPSTNPPRIGFIGLYSYAPNREGVRWFLRESWPAIRQAIPGIRFRMIGRDTDGPDKPLGSDVDGLGWVEDPATEIATWSAMVIPIQLGGGTRVKIADAFSRKCPVVSTRLGAFGYDVVDGRQLRLADSPEEFARVCIDVVHRPVESAQMAERAWGEFLEKWTWDAITPRVADAVGNCLRRSQGNNP